MATMTEQQMLNSEDAAIVRTLVRTHLLSGFPGGEVEPLTVGDVACRLRAEYTVGQVELRAADAAASRQILADQTPLSVRQTPRSIRAATSHLDVALSDHYWNRFHSAAVEMLLMRSGAR